LTFYSGTVFDMAVNQLGMEKVRAGKNTRRFFP